MEPVVLKRVARIILSSALAISFALHPIPATASNPLPEIGDAVQSEITTQPDIQPAYTGCGRVESSALNAGYEQRLVELTNQRRAEAGLPPLKRNTDLDYASRYHASDMMVEDYFGHDTQDRQYNNLVTVCTWNTRLNYYYPNWEYRAENVAAGYNTPEEVINGWMNSEGHRNNILSTSAREIGVGFMEVGGYYQRYWVQDFGRPSNVYPVIINREAASTDVLNVNLFIYGQGYWEEMRLRNNNEVWTSWQPFQQDRSWTLPAAVGNQTVSVEMRKSSGATSSSSDTIFVNGMANLPNQIYFIYNQSKGQFSPNSILLQPLSASGSTTFNWTASSNTSWLNLSQLSGTSPNSTISITPQNSGLDKAVNSGVVTVTSSMAMAGSPKGIQVNVAVVKALPYVAFLATVRR